MDPCGSTWHKQANAMRNTPRLFAQLLPGLLFGLIAAACGSGDVIDPRGRLVNEGKAGNSTTGPGNPFTDSGGTGNLGVVETPIDMPPPPGCGDGTLTSDEACDDGNNMSGDGCNAACLIVEKGFSCPNPGKPCRAIARCGDGIVASSEQCDDGNVVAGDGCSERCRVELGKKCEGAPSVCTPSKCGNGVVEGAESCDDGNTSPFDGCSALCLREPDCSSGSCVSGCGDGLLINEDCDDGNTVDGDGCSSTCKAETGFTCKQVAQCEKINGACVLRVPAIFRDFSGTDPDFNRPPYPDVTCGITEGDPIVKGIAKDLLDADGRPVLGTAPAKACIASASSFARWFRDNTGTVKVVGDLVLFDNAMGGYVNRFGKNGEKLVTTQKPAVGMGTEEQVNNATSKATCAAGCTQRARSSNAYQCENVCQTATQAVTQTTDTLTRRTAELTALQNAATPDATAIAAAEAAILTLQTTLETQTAAATKCTTDCQAKLDVYVTACVDDCKPCSYNSAQYCTGGKVVEYDGTPLYFPVDGVTGATADLDYAQLPLQYGYTGWPLESTAFPGAKKHNFSFTSEVQYWFRYDTNTSARLDFSGDDDVWVYVNGHLAVDLGGIHVPMDGSVTINAASAAKFDLKVGNVYKIVVFQAERKRWGSSFKLTLSGFEATPSDCSAVCGDGILSFGEECDDGVNDGGYGECDAGCKLGPFCGDGEVNGPEQCDKGPGGGQGCPGCRLLEAPK